MGWAAGRGGRGVEGWGVGDDGVGILVGGFWWGDVDVVVFCEQ